MACRTVNLENLGSAIVCSRGDRYCGACKRRKATRLCDWPRLGGRTCDAPLCDHCATSIGEDRDLCPPHARAHERATPAPAAEPDPGPAQLELGL